MRALALSLVFVSGFTLAGCETASPVAPPAVTALRLYAAVVGPSVVNVTAGTVNTPPGEEFQFFGKVQRDSGDEADVSSHVQWASSNTAVIEVSETGLVRTVGRGEARVVATFLEHAAFTTFRVQVD